MKTRIFGLTGGTLALATVGLLLVANRMEGEDSDPASNATITDTNTVAVDATYPPPAPPAYSPLPAAIPGNPLTLTNAPQTAPAGVKLSKGAADIARFAQSGISEDVMLAYVANINSPFNLGSDQIVYLNDLGVSGNVVKAMIQRDAAITAAAQAYAATLTPPAVNPVSPVPADDGSTQVTDTTPITPPYDPNAYVPTDDAEYFYSSLAPYGGWNYIAGVGLCWQPTVYLGNHDWRPYNDRGRWLYSDCGWYWQSDYSWGWATFHYGRWFEDPRCGWVWCPDRVWGPAWVSWRTSGDYCGWAPLPPSARFVPGTGFVFANHVVGAGFEFGLRAHHYTFIPLARMTDYNPARYGAARWQAEEIRNQTKVVTQVTDHNHHMFSRGVDPAAIAAVTTTEIRHAEIREQTGDGHRFAPPSDRLGKGSSGGLVIYRPQLPTPAHHATGGGNGGAPASQPSRNPNGPRTSVTPATTPVASTPSQNDALVARLKALQQQAIANQKAIDEQAAAARQANASHTETYPAGSLVLHGNGNTHPAVSQANYGNAAGNSTWPSEAPAHSYGNYTVVNGFARPTPQNAAQNNQTPNVIPRRYSASQRINGNSASYTVTSPATQPLNSHAQQISDAANAQSIPGRFTAAQQLNNAPVQNNGASPHLNSHAEQIMEAASRSHSEPHQDQRVESHHAESHTDSHPSFSPPPSAPPASHASSGGSSAPSSGNNSSGKH